MIAIRLFSLVSFAFAVSFCTQYASAQSTPTAVKREPVEFPNAAKRAGVESGTVRAKLTINAAGDVVDVLIVAARPARVFDSAVRNGLSSWKYNAGENNRTVEVEVVFK